ncbi:MAG: winged helix-turn-helix transcriptional regulator, partial [Candidatus Thorarchaeota archaeon]
EDSLTQLHKKVLRCLVDNPRLGISDIADCSGYSSKSVRRALKELDESKAIWFGARPDLAAGSLVNIHIRVEWNEKESSAEEIGHWLRDKYPVTLWDVWRTARHPVLYGEFVVEDLHEAQAIVLNIRESLKIKSTSTLVAYSSAKFRYLADIKLRELLDMK